MSCLLKEVLSLPQSGNEDPFCKLEKVPKRYFGACGAPSRSVPLRGEALVNEENH
jgi:hypothetical protein